MNPSSMKRRLILQGLLAVPCLATAGLHAPAALASAPLAAHKLSERLTLITGAGGNVVLFRGAQGVTLVDSGAGEQASDLLALVAQESDSAPVTTLFNTHWHAEHTGGNAAVNAQGAEILAHENTRLWMTADFEVYWRDTNHKPRPRAAWPETTFYESGAKDLGGETVLYKHPQQAHTDGDLYLLFPDSNVMVAGGLLSAGRYPICDIATGGWIGGLLEANAAMLGLANDDTIIVPDRGPALRKQDLQAQHDMLADLYEKMKELARQGFSGRDMLQEGVTSEYDDIWGDPTEFVLETYRGMWAHTYDMGGFI